MIVIVMPTIGNGMHAITDPTVNLAACGILNNSAYPAENTVVHVFHTLQ